MRGLHSPRRGSAVSGARFSKARVEEIRERALSNGELCCLKNSSARADLVGAVWSLAERLVGYEREAGWIANDLEATLYRAFIIESVGGAQVTASAKKTESDAARDELAARDAAKRKKVA